MYQTPLYNGHYFEVWMMSTVERFHCMSILINAMYFSFLLFVNAHHDHELISLKH